jgi:hypothetical protein
MKGTTGNSIVFRQFEISQSKIYIGMIVQGKNNHLVLSLILFVILFPDLTAQIEFTYQSDYSYVKGKDAASLPGRLLSDMETEQAAPSFQTCRTVIPLFF